MGAGLATGSTKLPRLSILENHVGGQRLKVEDNYVPAGSDFIRDVRIGICPAQYRERSNLPRVPEEKNAVPVMNIGDGFGLYDGSFPRTKCNRARDRLGQASGKPI